MKHKIEEMAVEDGHKPLSEKYGQQERLVARELFPLPEIAVEAGTQQALSRGCSQRVSQRREVQREINRTVRSLNFFAWW